MATIIKRGTHSLNPCLSDHPMLTTMEEKQSDFGSVSESPTGSKKRYLKLGQLKDTGSKGLSVGDLASKSSPPDKDSDISQ